MADLYNTVDSVNLLTAIGGAVGAGDRIFLIDSEQDYTSGTLSGAAAALLLVRSDFTGDIGSGGSAILVDLTSGTGTLDFNGGGAFAYFAPTTTIDLIVVRPDTPGVLKITTGTVTEWAAAGGQNIVAAAAVVTTLSAVDCTVTIEDSATAITLLTTDNATISTDRGASAVVCGARSTIVMANYARNFATMDIWGTIDYRGGNSAGASTTIRPGGVLNLSKAGGNITFTANIIGYPGGTLILPRTGPTITYTLTPIGVGPTILYQ